MSFPLKRRVIFFATGNINKFKEAQKVLSKRGITVAMLRMKSSEIQSDSLEEIACTSAAEAFEECHLPIIVEDAGLFVDALKGFPGPYASYVYRTIGNEGLLRLMEKTGNRRASFRSVIAYCSTDTELPTFFGGEVIGEIVRGERKGRSGFGFDPIFKPEDSYKTFAEMSISEKNGRSHRAKALRKFAAWYKKR